LFCTALKGNPDDERAAGAGWRKRGHRLAALRHPAIDHVGPDAVLTDAREKRIELRPQGGAVLAESCRDGRGEDRLAEGHQIGIRLHHLFERVDVAQAGVRLSGAHGQRNLLVGGVLQDRRVGKGLGGVDVVDGPELHGDALVLQVVEGRQRRRALRRGGERGEDRRGKRTEDRGSPSQLMHAHRLALSHPLH
jgi:hypothetical protein